MNPELTQLRQEFDEVSETLNRSLEVQRMLNALSVTTCSQLRDLGMSSLEALDVSIGIGQAWSRVSKYSDQLLDRMHAINHLMYPDVFGSTCERCHVA